MKMNTESKMMQKTQEQETFANNSAMYQFILFYFIFCF